MKIYGLIGYPVKHSLSAAMHNAAFRHLSIDAEYRLFEVRPDELANFFSVFKERYAGINITIPHKEASIKYMDDVKDEAKSIEAINTVVLEGEKLIGYNTDILGFAKSLKEDLKFSAKDKSAVIFGAGGASRACSFGLIGLGIKRIILVDIDKDKAASLADDLSRCRCDAIAVHNDKAAIRELVLNSDLLVNATPCGMKSNDPELLPSDYLHKDLAVFDLIYNPNQTPLIKEAKKRGLLRAINGLGMLLYQGAASFELWTGIEAPVEVMKRALSKI